MSMQFYITITMVSMTDIFKAGSCEFTCSRRILYGCSTGMHLTWFHYRLCWSWSCLDRPSIRCVVWVNGYIIPIHGHEVVIVLFFLKKSRRQCLGRRNSPKTRHEGIWLIDVYLASICTIDIFI